MRAGKSGSGTLPPTSIAYRLRWPPWPRLLKKKRRWPSSWGLRNSRAASRDSIEIVIFILSIPEMGARERFRKSSSKRARQLTVERGSARQGRFPAIQRQGFSKGERSGWRLCVGLEGALPPAHIMPGAQFIAHLVIDPDRAQAHAFM